MVIGTLPRSGLVLVFIRLKYQSQREKVSGVYSAAIQHGWQILPLDEEFSTKRLNDLIRLWHPIGCLIDLSALPNHLQGVKHIDKRSLAGIPTILLGRDTTRKRQILDCSVQNPRAPVLAATRKFRSLGLEHFAFLGAPQSPPWSVERGRHFQFAVKSWDFQSYSNIELTTKKSLASLVTWLRQLPRPIGLLLAADFMALPLYTAAKQAGLAIGTDLVVIGVDNDEQICNSLIPTLTSVRLNFFQAGENGIELLAKRISYPDLPVQYWQYGIIELVSRASTAQQYPDRRINQGIRFIEEYGCDRITISDVAESMGCGRRMAEKLFAKHTGMTILETIRKKRLAKAKTLLQNSHYPIDAIPGLVGYESVPHMKTYFRQQTGMTMREWRRAKSSHFN